MGSVLPVPCEYKPLLHIVKGLAQGVYYVGMKQQSLRLFWKVAMLPLMFVELLAVFGVLNVHVTYTTFGLLLTSTAVFATIEIVHHKIPNGGRAQLYWWSIMPVTMAVYIDAGGDFFHWYSTYPLFDTGLHFFGTFAATAFTWNIVSVFLKTKADARILLWATCATGIALGAVYEMEEYLEDFFTQSNRLGDGPDTGNDLAMDAIGAVLFIVLMILYRRHLRQRQKKS